MANQQSFVGSLVSAAGTPLVAVTTAAFSTTSATPVNATPASGPNLSIDLPIGTFVFRAVLPHTTANSITGFMTTAAFGGTSTAFSLARKDVGGTGDGSNTTALGTLLGQIGAGPGSTTARTLLLEGTITVSAPGTLQIQIASGVAASIATMLANASLSAFRSG